jgi:ABC-type uncharacterized transport system substrate-binding protein
MPPFFHQRKRLPAKIALLAFCAAMPLRLPAEDGGKKKAVVLFSTAMSFYEEAFQGFKNRLAARNAAVSIEGLVVSDSSVGQELQARELLQKHPDVVLSMGNSATLFARGKIQGVPSVFCLVVNPRANHLDTAGVSLSLKGAVLVKHLRDLFPQFQRIGVIYNDASDMDVIRDLERIEKDSGSNLLLVKVDSVDKLDAGLDKVKQTADCLLMLYNPSLFNSTTISQVILRSIQVKLPIISFSRPVVKAGTLAGIYADNADAGSSAGEMVSRILDGEAADQLPVQSAPRAKYAVNLIVAQRIGIQVKPSALQGADEVIR